MRRLLVSEFMTLDGVAEAWPVRDGDIADPMNAIPKHVVSTTLQAPLEWHNASLLEGELVQAVQALKQQDGGPIMVHGSLALTQSLLAANLVDDLRLMIFPVMVGGGRSIYPDGFHLSRFTLTSVDTVMPNVIALTYSRAS